MQARGFARWRWGRWLGIGWVCVAGCTTLPAVIEPTSGTLPAKYTLERPPLAIASDMPLPAHRRLLDELLDERTNLLATLALPSSQRPIQVFLFDSSERFNAFMQAKFPDLPMRRAFFIEENHQLRVYAQWGGRVAEDLRHEVAHGYLHASVPKITLWLDEGLAEYFEAPAGMSGLNQPHLREMTQRLAQGGWRPDLRRLEAMTDIAEMQQAEYAEAWAWVHFLLHTDPPRKELLRAHLQALSRGQAEPLSAALNRNVPHLEKQLADHIFRLAETP